jgi:hypothetical protein
MHTPRRAPLWLRLFYLVPILGWAARDIAQNGEENLGYGLFAVATAWASAALIFGYPGLIIPALILVPVIVLTLILITWD